MSTLVSDTPQRHYQENGNNENGVNFVLTPDIRPEIKNEPPEDIDDRQQLHSIEGVSPDDRRKPNIRLTPTMKLLASPNPVDPKRKFSCPYDNCTKSYGKSSHLRSHLTWHTGIKPYVCREPKCGKSFTRSDELNRHSRTHTGEKPFECMQCGKKFSRSDHLTKHVATHTKQLQSQKRTRVSINIDRRPMPNERSSVAAEQRPAVAEGGESRVDLSNGKSQPTDQQSNITSQDDAPAAKKRNTKSNELIPGQDIAYTDGMQFMASLLECAQFKHGRHVIETENLNDEQLEEARLPIRIKLEKPEHSDEYKIVNAAADKQEDSTLLNQTVKVKTEDESTERLQSDPHVAVYGDECNGIINAAEESDNEENANDDSILLEANATIPFSKPARAPTVAPPPRIENMERPYGCCQCPKSFKRQDDLNRHLRTHTGEKPYACTACEKRFMRSDHLKKHLKTHFKHL